MQVRPRGTMEEDEEWRVVRVKEGWSICLMSARNLARQGAGVVALVVDMVVMCCFALEGFTAALGGARGEMAFSMACRRSLGVIYTMNMNALNVKYVFLGKV